MRKKLNQFLDAFTVFSLHLHFHKNMMRPTDLCIIQLHFHEYFCFYRKKREFLYTSPYYAKLKYHMFHISFKSIVTTADTCLPV